MHPRCSPQAISFTFLRLVKKKKMNDFLVKIPSHSEANDHSRVLEAVPYRACVTYTAALQAANSNDQRSFKEKSPHHRKQHAAGMVNSMHGHGAAANASSVVRRDVGARCKCCQARARQFRSNRVSVGAMRADTRADNDSCSFIIINTRQLKLTCGPLPRRATCVGRPFPLLIARHFGLICGEKKKCEAHNF